MGSPSNFHISRYLVTLGNTTMFPKAKKNPGCHFNNWNDKGFVERVWPSGFDREQTSSDMTNAGAIPRVWKAERGGSSESLSPCSNFCGCNNIILSIMG